MTKQTLLANAVRTGAGVSAIFTPLDYSHCLLQVVIEAIDPAAKLSVYLGQALVGEELADTAAIEDVDASDFAIRKAFVVPITETLLDTVDARFLVSGGNCKFAASLIFVPGR